MIIKVRLSKQCLTRFIWPSRELRASSFQGLTVTAGRKIAPNTGANATKLYTLAKRSAVKMAIGCLCFCSRYFWPCILFLLLNVTSPGIEEKGKTILHRPMSFGFWFANVSSDLRLLLLDGHVCKVRHFGLSFRRRGFLAS